MSTVKILNPEHIFKRLNNTNGKNIFGDVIFNDIDFIVLLCCVQRKSKEI